MLVPILCACGASVFGTALIYAHTFSASASPRAIRGVWFAPPALVAAFAIGAAGQRVAERHTGVLLLSFNRRLPSP